MTQNKLRVKGVTSGGGTTTTTTTTTEAPTTTTTTTESPSVPQFNPTESSYVNSLVNSLVSGKKGNMYQFDMMLNSTEIQNYWTSNGTSDTEISVVHTWPGGPAGGEAFRVINSTDVDFSPISNPLNMDNFGILESGTYQLKLVSFNKIGAERANWQIIDVLDTFTMVV